MIIILKYKFQIILLLLIVFLYFLLRLPNLTLQPIFADEAIYIRWAQVMKAEPTLRFLPLSDGKTPLFMWLLIPLFKVLTDPLLAGRFLSVLSGFGTLLAAFLIGWKFFNVRTGLWSALLIAVTPYIVFFDRMALVDSMLAVFSIWSLLIALMLIHYPRVDLAMLLGYLLGGGMLTKTPGFFNMLALPTSIVAFKWIKHDRQRNLLKIFGLWLIAFFLAAIIYNILRLGPGFDSLSSRNQDYVFSPLELVGRPLDPFIPHFNDLRDWFPKLLTIPILILTLGGMIWTIITRNRVAVAIFLWSLLPLLIQMTLLRTFTARYLLFSIPPLLCLAGWFIVQMSEKIPWKRYSFVIFAVFVLPLALLFDYQLLVSPEKAGLPENERRGYLEDWTAGYGFSEIAQILIDESKKGGVVVGTEGSFGTLPDGLQIYLEKHAHTAPPNQQISVVPGRATVSAQLKQAASEHQTFFVANKSRYPYFEKGLVLIKEYPKAKSEAGTQDAILLFQVLPPRLYE